MKKSASQNLNQCFDSKKQFLQGFVNDRDKLRSLLNRSKELAQTQRIQGVLEQIEPVKPENKKKNVKKKVDYFAPIKMENKVNALRKSVDKLSKKQNKSIEEDSKAQEPRIIEVESLKEENKIS